MVVASVVVVLVDVVVVVVDEEEEEELEQAPKVIMPAPISTSVPRRSIGAR